MLGEWWQRSGHSNLQETNEKLQVRLRLTQAPNLSSKNKQTWAYFHKHIIKIIIITESNFLFIFLT